MNRVTCVYCFFVVIVFITGTLQAQTIEEAKKLYLDGQFADAMPAFEKAVVASPKNASYNQWYGTCLLNTGNPEEAEKYLKYAATKNIPEAYYSLGKLYFQIYRFEESSNAIEEYVAILTKKKQTEGIEPVKLLLNRSKKAARMLSHCENVQIIDSVIIPKKDFIKAYLLSEESGTLRESEEIPGSVIYENQLQDRRYYAKLNNNRFQLYFQTKLQNEWADERALILPSGSEDNNNFPYVLSDGITLYLAATGSESIGGYDLFVTRYNTNNDTYLTPEHLGMPFNSTANDYMLAMDEYSGIGYFATDRFQPENSVVIYTFIPNKEIKSIESDSLDFLANRAKITSIKDTWKPGVDYASMIRTIRSDLNKEQKKERDFYFFINDNLVYSTLNEFESDASRQLFVQSQSLNQQITNLEQQVDSQRREYSQANKNKKQTMQSSILSNETKLDDLHNQYNQLVIKTRNTEIKELRQHQ